MNKERFKLKAYEAWLNGEISYHEYETIMMGADLIFGKEVNDNAKLGEKHGNDQGKQ